VTLLGILTDLGNHDGDEIVYTDETLARAACCSYHKIDDNGVI